MKFCPKCGRQIPEGTNKCYYCQTCINVPPATPVAAEPAPAKKSKKRAIIISVAAVVLVVAVFAVLVLTHVICLDHSWEKATCETPKTCEHCGKTEGQPIDHSWLAATCTKPETCEFCMKTTGEPIEHEWQDATCTEPETCEFCDATQGKALGHEWQDATCTEPETCETCAETRGKAKGHNPKNWEVVVAATLISGGEEEQFCADCSERIGERKTDKKTPKIIGNAFNFTDTEFIDYLKTTPLVDHFDMSVKINNDKFTGYKMHMYNGVVCALVAMHDDNGKVCAVGVYSDSMTDAIDAAGVIGERINPDFSAKEARKDIESGGVYTKAEMSAFVLDEGDGFYTALLFPTTLLAEILAQ